MIKTIYIVEFHTYWEHYGATPSRHEYSTLAEAQKAAAKFESDNFYEDGYFADLYKKSEVVFTEEDKNKQYLRSLNKKINILVNPREAQEYGIYHFWDGSKERYVIFQDEDGIYYICFYSNKEIIGYELNNFPMDYDECRKVFFCSGKQC